MKYLQENIKYPEEAKELGIQGRVFVTFVVEVDGSITDVRVLRGIGGGCDEEAIRVVQNYAEMGSRQTARGSCPGSVQPADQVYIAVNQLVTAE